MREQLIGLDVGATADGNLPYCRGAEVAETRMKSLSAFSVSLW